MLEKIRIRLRQTDPAQRRAGGNIGKFMIILLVLTLIARGTGGATLARVVLASPERNEIIDAVTGFASVYASDSIRVYAPAGLRISEMPVHMGQMVTRGEAIAVFDEAYIQEAYIRAAAALAQMEIDLRQLEQQQRVDDSNLRIAQRALERAQADYEATVRQGEADIQEAQAAVNALAQATGQLAALRNHQRALADLQAVLAQTEADIEAAREALENIGETDTALQNARRSHERALEDYENTHMQNQADIDAAREALATIEETDTNLQNAIRNHQRALEDYENTRTQGEADIEEAQRHLTAVQRGTTTIDRTAVENAQRNARRARDDANTNRQQHEENVQQAQDALANAQHAYHFLWFAVPPASAEALAAARAAVTQAQQTLTNAEAAAQSGRLADTRRVEDAEAALSQAQRGLTTATQNERDQATTALENAQNRLEDNLRTALRRLEDTETALTQAQNNATNQAETTLENAINRAEDNQRTNQRRLEDTYTTLTQAYENAHNQATRALENAQNQAATQIQNAQHRVEDTAAAIHNDIERAQNQLTHTINTAESNRTQANRRIEDARQTLTTAQQNHNQSTQQAQDTDARNQINAGTLQLDINEQSAEIETLQALIYNNGVLYANYEGSVSFAPEAGGLTGTAPLLILRDTSGGFHAQLTLPRNQAERLTVGGEAIVTTGGGSMFFIPTATGIVSAISNPNDNDDVTVTITLPDGNWQPGQRVEAQVILSRANYDFSLPISALHSDNIGYFLLVAEQRNTIMGVQNVVVRVNVNLIASDAHFASVMGAIDRNSRVITGSNRAVTVGDRIRES